MNTGRIPFLRQIASMPVVLYEFVRRHQLSLSSRFGVSCRQ
jgi:hypothetical protein